MSASRASAIVDAPFLALRKPARIVFWLDDCVNRGILSGRQHRALADAVRAHDTMPGRVP